MYSSLYLLARIVYYRGSAMGQDMRYLGMKANHYYGNHLHDRRKYKVLCLRIEVWGPMEAIQSQSP